MRWIYGCPDDLSKTHILLGRFRLSEVYEADTFLREFKEKHPTYGCHLFLEEGEVAGSIPEDLYRLFAARKVLHHVHKSSAYCTATDTLIRNVVLSPDGFPPYLDDDPEVEESPLSYRSLSPLADSLCSSLRAEIMDPPHLRSPSFATEILAPRDISKEYVLHTLKGKILNMFRDCSECWEISEERVDVDTIRYRTIFHPERLSKK